MNITVVPRTDSSIPQVTPYAQTFDQEALPINADYASLGAPEKLLRPPVKKGRYGATNLSHVSHEIRNPMSGIISIADMLQQSPLSDEQRHFVRTIRNSGEALLALLNDLSDYSTIETQGLTLQNTSFNLEAVLHDTMLLLAPQAYDKRIELITDCDLPPQQHFIADPARIRQILMNLLGNAVKFTETGHILTRVYMTNHGDNLANVHILIEDTGCGIPLEDQSNIFEEFVQLDQGDTTGSGLGLAIAKKIVTQMDGAIWVESEPEKGSCFGVTLTLPISDSPLIAPLETTLRVLIIDSHIISRTVLERFFLGQGLRPTSCKSVTEGLYILEKTGTYDAILLNHFPSQTNNLDMINDIRAKGIETPIIVLSPTAISLRQQEHLSTIDAILQKPFLGSELTQQLSVLTSPASGNDPHTHEAAAPVISGSDVKHEAPFLLRNPLPPLESMPFVPASDAETQPLTQLDGPAVTCEQPPPEPPPSAEAPPRLMRVMVADDNRTNQLVFKKMIGDLPVELIFVTSGREAVETAVSQRPDLIFMDLHMPEMNGRQAIHHIRDLSDDMANTPIIAFSAEPLHHGEESVSIGASQFMSKPLHKTTLIQALHEFFPDEGSLVPLDTGSPAEFLKKGEENYAN